MVALLGEATGTLQSIVTANMLSGVLTEIVELLPVVIPALLGFIAIRKGISFVLGNMRKA